MSNSISVINNNTQIQNSFTAEKVALIKNTVAQGATDMELQLFIEQCKRTGLDPITRQIYFIKDNRGKVQIQTSIDGFRLVAERSGNYEGQTAPMWCGEDGKWVDVWLKKTPPAACKVGVYKKGFREALMAVAIFDEYCQRKSDGSPTFMWQKMPGLMIQKVAESLALRKAFPNDLSGLYTQEEMAQATPEPAVKEIKNVVLPNNSQINPRAAQQGPAPFEASVSPEASEGAGAPQFDQDPTQMPDCLTYVVPFGKKHKGKTLEEIGVEDAASFAAWLQGQADQEGKPLNPQGVEFIQMVEAFIRLKREAR
jgi:phage recombination protein Bet